MQFVGSAGLAGILIGCRSNSHEVKRVNVDGSRIPYGEDQLQFGHLQVPTGAGPHPVAVVIHGGFWRSQYGLDHIAPMCPALNAAGWATWNIEYRRVGNPGGGWPGTFLDVADAADFVRNLALEHRLDLSRVVSIGHSAGGHLALWLAGRQRVRSNSEIYRANPISLKAAVSLAGVADLRRGHEQFLGQGAVRSLIGGNPDSHADRYAAGSPAELLPLGVRQVLIHGTDDPIVPIGISQAYYQAANSKRDPIELIELDGTGHFELVSPTTQQGRRVIDAMSKLL
jgi:acetyl esterase/lipase